MLFDLKIYSLKIHRVTLPDDEVFSSSFTDVLVFPTVLLLVEEKFTPSLEILTIDFITYEIAGAFLVCFNCFHNVVCF